MKHFITILFNAFILSGLSAQTLMNLPNGCAFDSSGTMVNEVYVFNPSKEALAIVKQITDAVGTRPKFEVLSADVDNAEARFDAKTGKRYILYSEEYIDDLVNNTGTKWALYFVFAHEIAHHYNGDALDEDEHWQQKELDADKFAGTVLCNLGATLKDVRLATAGLSKTTSKRHPARSARTASVIAGWKVKCEKEPVTPTKEPVVGDGGAKPCQGKQKICFHTDNAKANGRLISVILTQKGQKKAELLLSPKSTECSYQLPPGIYDYTANWALEGGWTGDLMRRGQVELKACEDITIEL